MLSLIRVVYHKVKMNRIKKNLKANAILEKNVILSKDTVLEGNNRIAENTRVINSHLGVGTYIGQNSDLSCSKMGNYTCIGSRVIVIRGTHPMGLVSMHPAFYSVNKQAGFSYVNEQKVEEFTFADLENKYAVIVGNDVWIGADVRIIEGVSIGDGAVVMAGSIVTEDVPPYAVVGGVPAKIVKYRFQEEIITELLEVKWWNKGDEWIKNNADYFDNVESFINRYNKREINYDNA